MMMHSCGICGNEWVDADLVETNYLRSTKQWVCEYCLEDYGADLKQQIAAEKIRLAEKSA